jgi:hypothetical protein
MSVVKKIKIKIIDDYEIFRIIKNPETGWLDRREAKG